MLNIIFLVEKKIFNNTSFKNFNISYLYNIHCSKLYFYRFKWVENNFEKKKV